jgi:hypothetical protein
MTILDPPFIEAIFPKYVFQYIPEYGNTFMPVFLRSSSPSNVSQIELFPHEIQRIDSGRMKVRRICRLAIISSTQKSLIVTNLDLIDTLIDHKSYPLPSQSS